MKSMLSRRRLLRDASAAAMAGLAGCGRSFRRNSIPGGLDLRNTDDVAHELTVRATTVEELETPPPSGDEEPKPRPIDPVVAEGTYDLAPSTQRAVPDFFPEAGNYLVEATLPEGASARAKLRLYDSLPGPAGADTVIVRIGGDGSLSAMATQVD